MSLQILQGQNKYYFEIQYPEYSMNAAKTSCLQHNH